MKRYALVGSVLIMVVGVGLGAIYVARSLTPSYRRETFRQLDNNVFHPSFFSRFAFAREHGMAWISHPYAVALDYVGRTRNCPTQQMEVLSSEQYQMVMIITRECPYSNLATTRQFRVDLTLRDGAWEIVWAGMRLKCALNQNELAVFMLRHNPARRIQASWAKPVREAIDSLSDALNPWLTECP